MVSLITNDFTNSTCLFQYMLYSLNGLLFIYVVYSLMVYDLL